MLRDLVSSTMRSLWAHAFRFGLTALGIVWGAAMLTYLSASADGYDRHFEGQPFEVVGVARAKGDQLLFMGPPDDEIAFSPFTTARVWFTRTDVVDQLAFAPRTREGSHDAVRLVRATLGRHHGFQQSDD